MQQGQRSFEGVVTKAVRCRYLVWRPQASVGGNGPWPLVMFLHGVGQSGDDLEMVRKHGPPKLASEGRDFPFVLVCPQCPAGRWWDNDMLSALLDAVLEEQDVDPDRVYLTGLSMGSFGTWSLATQCPERFAAILPICGGGYPYLAERLRGLPIWAFHGAKDQVVPLRESERMVDAVNAAGGHAKLTVYPDAQHDAWTQTYTNPDAWDWLLSHRRSELR